MSDVVIDSSVATKWIVPEADSSQATLLMAETTAKAGRLMVLDLALVEVGNAIWKRHHMGLATIAEARQGLHLFRALALPIEPAQRLLDPALEIAMKYDRALYDALFVALANDLKLTGVTADEPLYRAVSADFPNIVLLRQ